MPDQPVSVAWAASGAMALTGREDGPPLVPPGGVIQRILGLGEPIGVDALGLLAERAAVTGHTRQGRISCGGAAHLVPGRDGWLAVNLARPDDRAAVGAWLATTGGDGPGDDPGIRPIGDDEVWTAVERSASVLPVAELGARAAVLGLPVSILGEVTAPEPDGTSGLPVTATAFPGPVAGAGPGAGPLVVDLSALWAGPLCARLLADRGARVVKVESPDRLDGARRGPPAFYDRLHAGTRSVVLDFTTAAGRAALGALVDRADVVVTAARRRALDRLGIGPEAVLGSGRGPSVWVSVTGYGLGVDRVAFGDDAAVAGGLVATDDVGRCFVADAVADPLAGVCAAAAAAGALVAGGRQLLDVSMAGVAAFVAGADRGIPWPAPPRLVAAPPRPLAAAGRAPEPGADTAAVLAELGVPEP